MSSRFRRAFLLFHMVLGLSLLCLGLEKLHHAVHEWDSGHRHLAFVGGVETLGALLFLIPRTVRWGGGVLLFTQLASFVMQLTRAELRPGYLIAAAGVWLVMAGRSEVKESGATT